MIMLPRFYAPNADGLTIDIALPAEEARHALAVLRLRVDDELVVFDGRGREWQARIASISKTRVTVRLGAEQHSALEPRVRVVLLQATLKGDHMDAVVRDATMLGVAAIWPMITAHTAVNPKAASGAGAQNRWLRVAIASAKQCRRATVPVIRAGAPLGTAVQDVTLRTCDARILLVEPVVRDRLQEHSTTVVQTAALAVGPEGGWAREELEQFARAGFVSLTMGALTLRADAAALVALSVLRERWKDL